MAKVLPFRGLRYAPRQIPNLSRLVTPPYDIIGPEQQSAFYHAHPYNIIRLELGKTSGKDTPQDNRYTRARNTLRDWMQRGVLTQDDQPGFYLIESQYQDIRGKKYRFQGCFARVGLEPLGQGQILPHEKTFAGPKADRLELLKATGVSFSPVFSLFRDERQVLTRAFQRWARRSPNNDFIDPAGCRHRLWRVTDAREIAIVQKTLTDQPLLIADGHHRYTTALNFRATPEGRNCPDADSVMMCLADTRRSGLTVLPVFRLVSGVMSPDLQALKESLQKDFTLTQLSSAALTAQIYAGKPSVRPVLGWIAPGGRQAFRLTPKPRLLKALAARPDQTALTARLDVVLLNHGVLESRLGIAPGEEQGRVTYTKDLAEAWSLVRSGRAQTAFLPSRPNLHTIWKLSRQGQTMPQKSTYFLPKLITGLVMNPVRLSETLAQD